MFETNAASEIEYKVSSNSNLVPNQTVCDFGCTVSQRVTAGFFQFLLGNQENNTTWSRVLDLSFTFGIPYEELDYSFLYIYIYIYIYKHICINTQTTVSREVKQSVEEKEKVNKWT